MKKIYLLNFIINFNGVCYDDMLKIGLAFHEYDKPEPYEFSFSDVTYHLL